MKITFSSSGSLPSGQNIQQAVEAVLKKTLQEIGESLADTARTVAPILTGDLRASLKAEPITQAGQTYTVKVVSDISYAATMEFHQIKTLVGPPIYGLGPLSSQADAAYSGPIPGSVGGSFIQRSANYLAPLWLLKIKKDLETKVGASIKGTIRL